MAVGSVAGIFAVEGEAAAVPDVDGVFTYHSASAEAVREAADDAMGHATLWRGDKSCGVFTPLPPVQQRLQRALKAEFDPHGLFNRA